MNLVTRHEGLTSTPPCSLRVCETVAIPLAVACAFARIASASPDLTQKKKKNQDYFKEKSKDVKEVSDNACKITVLGPRK